MTSVILAWLTKTGLLMVMGNDLGSAGEMLACHPEVGTLMIPLVGPFLKKSSCKVLKSYRRSSLFMDTRRKIPRAHADSLGVDVIDEWGRMIPDPDRWPSSKGGKGFTEVAKEVHSLGLKFGIHVMNGISTQAINKNTTILDTTKV
ncbi:Glycoside hydrolase [Parasponia andersonii]|uniref:Glycoside hydrolase n=1 Tax=Parasponia andersonii TaxID=3476 RepID=A0A2P5AV72_PARAD|nr:Glycoside hydrolase [Parasponia andersonii]